MSRRWRSPDPRWWGSALLAALVWLVYGDIARHPFIKLDDFAYITGNPAVLRGLSSEGVRWAFTSLHEANWHPLTWLSHMLDVQLFGLHAGAHHLVGLLLHAANAAMLFGVLVRMTGAPWRCLLVAALFAVHPLHVESVAWAAERKDLLSAFFSIATLSAYARYAARPRAARYLPVLAAFAAGLLAKPMGVTIPFVLLLLDVWPLGRWPALPPARLIAEKVPLFALAAASSAVTLLAQRSGGAAVPLNVIPLGFRAANAVVSAAGYLEKTLWPSALAVFYPHPWYTGGLSWARVCASALALLLVTAAALRWKARHPSFPVGWFIFLGMLVPVSGLVQVGSQAMADRYTYLPLAGVFIALAWGTADLGARRQSGRVAVAAFWIAATLALCVAARAQVSLWRSDEALLSHALAVAPSWLVHENLGEVREEGGSIEAAMAQYRAAIALAPGYAEARHRLADILVRQGQDDEAVRQLRAVLRAAPADGLAAYKLGGILFRLGQKDEAIGWFRRAVEVMPDDAAAHSNLGYALLDRGRVAEAAAQFREALRLDPADPVALRNLAVASGSSADSGRGRQ